MSFRDDRVFRDEDRARVPPVTVLKVPEYIGARGYGAKFDPEQKAILIPYNRAEDEVFKDVKDKTRIVVMLRERFNALPMWEGD